MNPRSSSVRRVDLDDLKSKQIAFLHQRLVSPAARAEWRTNIAKILDELLEQPLGQLVDANALTSAIDASLVRSVLDPTVHPVVARTVKELRALLVAERGKIGTFVPPNAQQGLRDLATRSVPILAPLVREVSEHEAARLVMTDVLHDALVQFSDRVNPFVAEWGLPSIMKKFSPFGLGGVGKSIDGMRVEFEKRLEPEIRKFLIGFSREALRKGAASIISQSDTPAFIALRQKILTFVLDQRFADLLLEERDNETVTKVAVDVILHVCTDEKLAQQRRQIVKEFVTAHAGSKLRDVVVAYGGPDKLPSPVVEAVAEATFPAFAAAVGSATGKQWLDGLVTEFFDGLIAGDETAKAE